MEMPMELNKETAFRLWAVQFGKTAKAVDFAGREIAKAAYNNRNSKFGWNVDHIYPQSRGGKTADYNLICCHIKTNDEKADKFPCFVSNEIHFEIQKRQNHYEIIPKESRSDAAKNEENVNFFDAAQGMKFWKSCSRGRNQDIFAGYIKIRIEANDAEDSFLTQFYNFLKELFAVSLIFVNTVKSGINGWTSPCCLCYREFTVIFPDLPTLQESEELLDNCIVLNTYAALFREKYQRKINIFCGMKCYASSVQMSENLISDIVNSRLPFNEALSVDELIRINTSAEEKLSENPYKNFYSGKNIYPYNIIFTKLDKDLQKYL